MRKPIAPKREWSATKLSALVQVPMNMPAVPGATVYTVMVEAANTPIPPEGAGWRLVGAVCDSGVAIWYWEREVAP